jgi:hypothetical protein
MATSSAWVAKTVNDKAVYTCNVTGTTSDADLMTVRTPKGFNGAKPWSLIVYINEDLTASGASAVDIWGGTTDTCSLATADAGTDAYLVCALSADLDAGGTQVTHVFPGVNGGTFTQVVNSATLNFAIIPPYPYFIINVDMTAVLQDAATVYFTIIQ